MNYFQIRRYPRLAPSRTFPTQNFLRAAARELAAEHPARCARRLRSQGILAAQGARKMNHFWEFVAFAIMATCKINGGMDKLV